MLQGPSEIASQFHSPCDDCFHYIVHVPEILQKLFHPLVTESCLRNHVAPICPEQSIPPPLTLGFSLSAGHLTPESLGVCFSEIYCLKAWNRISQPLGPRLATVDCLHRTVKPLGFFLNQVKQRLGWGWWILVLCAFKRSVSHRVQSNAWGSVALKEEPGVESLMWWLEKKAERD